MKIAEKYVYYDSDGIQVDFRTDTFEYYCLKINKNKDDTNPIEYEANYLKISEDDIKELNFKSTDINEIIKFFNSKSEPVIFIFKKLNLLDHLNSYYEKY